MKNFISLIFSMLLLLAINAQTTHDVNSGNFYYNPQTITIDVGDAVHWINDGGFHNVNFDINTITQTSFNNPESFSSTPTSNVDIYTHTFTIPGTYQYDCSVGQHAANGMVGTVIVNSSSTSVAENTIPINSFNAFYQESNHCIQFNVVVDQQNSNAKLSIYDIEGKLVNEQQINVYEGNNKGAIVLEERLSLGVYLVSFSTQRATVTKKIIVN